MNYLQCYQKHGQHPQQRRFFAVSYDEAKVKFSSMVWRDLLNRDDTYFIGTPDMYKLMFPEKEYDGVGIYNKQGKQIISDRDSFSDEFNTEFGQWKLNKW